MEKHKILIVDDEAAIRMIVKTALGDDDFSFREAEDGGTALEAIQEEQPDLVLCDYEMPQMDGFELVRRIKKDKAMSTVPVLMLTSHDSYSRAMQGIEAGADEYVVKPFDPDELKTRVLFQLERKARGETGSVEFPRMKDSIDLSKE